MKNRITGYDNLHLSNQYLADMRAGKIPGWSANDKFGRNGDVGTTFEALWTVGGNPTFQTSASTIEAISTDADDTAAGAGARTIIVFGLDSNFNEISETLSMNGTSASSASIQSFIRVNRAYVATCGTYGGTNQGDITIRVSSAGDTFTEIEADAGQTHQGFFTVPANKRIYVYSLHISVDGTKTATVRSRIRMNADDTSAPVSAWRDQIYLPGISGFIENTFHVPWVGYEKTDMVVQAKVASTAAAISCYWEYALEDI